MTIHCTIWVNTAAIATTTKVTPNDPNNGATPFTKPSGACPTPTLNHSNPVNKCARKYSANVHTDANTNAKNKGFFGFAHAVNAPASMGYSERKAQNKNAANQAIGNGIPPNSFRLMRTHDTPARK